jgi:adenosylcobinamide-GDP ribazoletransferase
MNPNHIPAAAWATDLRVAVGFLTRLPVPQPETLPSGGLAQAMRAFPVAGAVVGLLAGGVFWLGAQAFTPVIAAVLAVLAAVWLTGGLHEDGLADTADGFGGGRDVLRRLEIMRDSRIGSYGVLAVVLALMLRVVALAALAPMAGLAALVAAGALSRAVMPLAMRLLPPARSDGLGRGAGRPPSSVVATALLLAAILALACLPLATGAAALLAALAATIAVARLAEARIGGYTGDVLGALQQAAEAAVLLCAVALP